MPTNSWIISRKTDGVGVLETYNPRMLDKINRDAYNVETAHEYLCRVNREIRGGSTAYNSPDR